MRRVGLNRWVFLWRKLAVHGRALVPGWIKMCCCPIVWRARPSSIATNPLTRAALRQLGSKPRPFGAIRSHRDAAAGIASMPPSCILRTAFALPHHALRYQPVPRTARACRMTHDQLCASIGLGSRRALALLSPALASRCLFSGRGAWTPVRERLSARFTRLS